MHNANFKDSVIGEVWAAITADGGNFYNPDAPVPIVRVGNAGDVGVAQFSNILFTVADVIQGRAIPLQILEG